MQWDMFAVDVKITFVAVREGQEKNQGQVLWGGLVDGMIVSLRRALVSGALCFSNFVKMKTLVPKGEGNVMWG